MAISEVYENAATIGSTEYSLPGNSTTLASITDDGMYECWLELNNLAAGDTFVVRLYEKVRATSTKRVAHTWTLSGAQADPNFVIPGIILLHGWDYTIQKTAGTDRSIAWSIRKVA